MARPKAFDPDEALDEAVECFRRRGFAGTSLDHLTAAMGIGRQSLYATYGGKRALFLRALTRYADGVVMRYVHALAREAPPIEVIADVLHEVARFARTPRGADGCFMTNSAADRASRDPAVRAIVVDAYRRVEDAFAGALERARAEGTLPAGRDPRALARFLVTFIQGVRVVGATRPDADRLRADVAGALRCLD